MLPSRTKNGGCSFYIHILQLALNHSDNRLGPAIHASLIKTSLHNIFLTNRLIELYSKLNRIGPARQLFDEMPERNTYAWNTMIGGYARNGRAGEAEELFRRMPEPNSVTWNSMITGFTQNNMHHEAIVVFCRMRRHGLGIDGFSLVSLLSVCSAFKALEWVKQILGVVIVTGLELNNIMLNVFVDALLKCGDLEYSRLMFDSIIVKDVVTWTSMVSGYARQGWLEEACRLFEEMPVKGSISWTALIAGFVQNGHAERALEFFARLLRERVVPNEFTYSSVISACSDLVILETGKQLHGCVLRRIGEPNVFISNALVDMYAKCGEMEMAVTVFNQMKDKDIISWNALITGFAHNGDGRSSLDVFEKMQMSGVVSNAVTFLGVLSACSHAGLVLEGHKYLKTMEVNHGISPRSDHYSIMIDLLGRSGRLNEAFELIMSIKEEPDAATWGALLGACHMHGNLEIAREAAEVLFHLEPMNADRYVSLANVFAASKKWRQVELLRAFMRQRGIKKKPGYSWVETKNGRSYFAAEDTSHNKTDDIYAMLEMLTEQIMDENRISWTPEGE